MACPATTDIDYRVEVEGDSDYGSDFSSEDEQLINHLLTGQKRVEVIKDNTIVTGLEYYEQAQTVRVPRVLGRERIHGTLPKRSSVSEDSSLSGAAFDSENPDLSHTESRIDGAISGLKAPVDDKLDTRSPIERFRTSLGKSLSVTDLVSPAWCELQYWYSLKIYGKKLQTKAMKEGSVVHKELEEQIHTTVKVKIATREDAWGLRIWNVLQGLRTLQEIGRTRELEVWAIVDGHVVNGIIDEISFICPDAELEAQLEKAQKSSKEELPADQTTISDYFKASGNTSISYSLGSKKPVLSRKVYICDVKTRTTQRLPAGAAFRPTKMQLMLYHHLLSSLATNQVDLSILLNRFDLDGEKPFSDSFIAQIGNLNDGIPADSVLDIRTDSSPLPSQDSMTVLLEHNSLRQLWSLMIETFQNLLPAGRDSIGKVLRVEYRSREHGDVLGSSTLTMDDNVLQVYLDHEMKWWKGEREPLGVVIEEAYKCRSCDFADICDWRRERVAEATEKARANKKAHGELKK